MKKSKIRNLLNNWNLEENEYNFIPFIKTILLTTNQGVDCRRDSICFDTDNDMVKIKQYFSSGKSGRLIDFHAEGDTLESSSYIYTLHPTMPFRAPMAGDIVYSINTNKEVVLKGIIRETNGLNRIKLDRPFNETDQDLAIGYTDQNVNNYTQDVNDKSLFLKMTPVSNLETDIYLDSNLIIGFEMTSARIGNS